MTAGTSSRRTDDETRERPVRVLQLGASDTVGARFNGLSLQAKLAQRGVELRHLVWNKRGDDPAVSLAFPWPGIRRFSRWSARREHAMSRRTRLQLHSWLLPLQEAFHWADVVHLQIIHDGWLSLDVLPWLSRRRPMVWTWHDPWPMTGHCIYPIDCPLWRTGCGQCPALDRPFPMRTDRSAEEFAWKQRLLPRLDADIVVASRSMLEMAQASPIACGQRLHLIPFGIDLQRFRPGGTEAARRRLGVLPGRVVIAVRAASENPFKGFDHAVRALQSLGTTTHPICILTTHATGVALELMNRFQVIELGWVDDEQIMVDSFRAADILLAPSLAEAFGMMPIEAMACGKAVIVYEGTSLTEVTGAPEVGLSVPAGDIAALASAVHHLVEDTDERNRRGRCGRLLTESRYDDTVFAERLAALYRAALARRQRPRIGSATTKAQPG